MLNFVKASRLSIAVAAYAVAGVVTSASAGQSVQPSVIVSPLKAATVNVGNRRAVSFYVAAQDKCKVTVLIADKFGETDTEYPKAVRVHMTVDGGQKANIDTPEGPALVFTCSVGASTMVVEKFDRMAAYAPAK